MAVTRTAFGSVLGHPTRPNIRFFNTPDDGGGAGDSAGEGDQGAGGDDEGDGLGDKGKQALDRMKRERNDARAEAAAFKALGLTPDQIKALQSSTGKPAPTPGPDADEIRSAVETAATARLEATARRTAVREQARALGFHDVKDALAEISAEDLAKVTVTDDEADAASIAELVKAIAAKKPYLVKEAGASHQDAGIGGAGGGEKPAVRPGLDRIKNAYETTSRSH